MPRIIIVRGIKELEGKFKKLSQKNLGKRVAKKLAERIEQNMKVFVPYWKGNLAKSIKAIPFGDGFAISMNFYGQFVETGTAPHPISDRNFLFKLWASDKGIRWSNLKFIVGRYGTKPHPFIEPAVNEAIGSFDQTANFVVKQTLKESGFNER